ncbi:MAG: winged helix-turn-helix transcriptional regulator [Archaeoglobus sp.]|uniref:ArsR/SmtB family transcription factor n=1 Tax=Archaeoglobus sp. TaxID=1872626 RepID=UPI001D88DC1E|nr:winged helix-turn-helix domain-containing protein [Archaeoglobus sp.]MBO8180328.1 winged helix-turn-helix transcriptional regulator [Archaeoglobus sp.]
MLEELLEKIEEIGTKVDVLQDSVMVLGTAVEALVEKNSREEFLSELKVAVRDEYYKIKELSPDSCKFRSFCLSRVDKATSRVIRIYAERGSEDALEELKKHKEAVSRYLNSTVCPDRNCMESIVDTFETLESFIRQSMEIKEHRRAVLRQWKKIEEIDEELLAEILSPLSNPIRIKILKTLARGGKSYAELERAVGIKGGHLQFHLRNLMEAGYVAQEGLRKRYVITHTALSVLNQLAGLGEVKLQHKES